MATFRCRFAAEEHGLLLEGRAIEHGQDVAIPHQLLERRLILGPLDLLLAIRVEQIRGRCEAQLVLVRNAADLAQEVRQVTKLRKTCQLGDVVQPDVQESSYSCALDAAEEALR